MTEIGGKEERRPGQRTEQAVTKTTCSGIVVADTGC